MTTTLTQPTTKPAGTTEVLFSDRNETNPDGTLNIAGIIRRIREITEPAGIPAMVRGEGWTRRCGEEDGPNGVFALVSDIQLRMLNCWVHVFDHTDDAGNGWTSAAWARTVARNVLREHERHHRTGGMTRIPADFHLDHMEDLTGEPIVTAFLGTGGQPATTSRDPGFDKGSDRIATRLDPNDPDTTAVYKRALKVMNGIHTILLATSREAIWNRLARGEIRLTKTARSALGRAIINLYQGRDPSADIDAAVTALANQNRKHA